MVDSDNKIEAWTYGVIDEIKAEFSLNEAHASKDSDYFTFEVHSSNGEAKAILAFTALFRRMGLIKDSETVSLRERKDNYTVFTDCDDMDLDGDQAWYVARFNPQAIKTSPGVERETDRTHTMKSKVKIVRGDITTFRGDAIVNAANERMLGGGGVDGAIHRAAGPELLAECRKVAEVRPGVRCPTGEARITPGGRLIAKWVIHTVGPDCSVGMFAEAPELLANCYWNSLSLAVENGIRKIAFPSISTGVFDFPKDEAAKIAIGVIKDFLETHPDVEVFFFGSPDTMEYYEKEARRQGLK